MPPQPKADETVALSYKADDGSAVEVEGICKITEDSIECWNPDGTPDPDLKQRIQAALVKQKSFNGQGPMLNLQYGKKNRIVVFKITQAPGGRGGHMDVQYAGDRYGFRGGMYINLDQPQSFTANQPYVRYQTMGACEEPSATTTKARIEISVPVSDRPTIEAKPGASFTWTERLTPSCRSTRGRQTRG